VSPHEDQSGGEGSEREKTYRFVLGLEIVQILVQDLDEELHVHGGVHAGIGNAQRLLEALQHALALLEALTLHTRIRL
jgi:hypothetical protein